MDVRMDASTASSKELLMRTLADSASQVDHEAIRRATSQLEKWKRDPGFFSTLQNIFLDRNAPDEIRFRSIIYLKNNIDRAWRKTSKSSFPLLQQHFDFLYGRGLICRAIIEEEKAVIRRDLIHALTLHLPRPWIATTAYTIGRIARHDFPLFWPDLVTQLRDTVQHAFELEAHAPHEGQWRMENALTGLAAVIKELSSVKLGPAVSAFHGATSEIFRFLGEIYQHMTIQWTQKLPSASPQMSFSAKILGIMRKLLVYGYQRSGDQIDTQAFFDLAVSHLSDFYQCYHNLHGESQEQVLKHVAKLTKFFSAYAAERPFEFLIMHNAPTTVSIFVQICQHEAEQFNKPAAETDELKLAVLSKIVIGGISMIRSLLRAVSDPRILEKEQKTRGEQVAAATNTIETIFNSVTVSDLATLLLQHFLILREFDLEAWKDDPEEWELEVTGDVVGAESGFRIAGEALFMELVSNYKDVMLNFLAGCIQSLQRPDMMTVIFRESIYNAITLNALALYDLVDFDSWLLTNIPSELSYSGPNHKVLRRRMALLISEWVGTKCSESSRPRVYETLLSLLTPLDSRNDAVVRLSAANALRYAVDEWHFKVEDFLPYLDAVLIGTQEEGGKGGIFGLMEFVQRIEAGMKLIRVVDVIVERIDRRITPYVPSIMRFLPVLWQSSEEQKIFRASVLSVLKTLVGALGERSVDYHSFIIELINLGTDPNKQEEFIYLFEDALDLWEETIKNAPTEIKTQDPTPFTLIGLFPKAISCLSLGSENLKKVLRIIESYMILDPVGLMQRYASLIFAGFAGLTNEALKAEANRMAMGVVETAIQGYPFIDLYFESFVASGLFFKILAAVMDDENMIVTSQNMNILARISLQNPEILLHFLREMDPSPEIVSRFVDKWAGPKFDSIGQAKSRKLNAMGLTALLRTNDQQVIHKLGAIMNVWFNVLSEVKDSEGGDALIYWRSEEEGDENSDFTGTSYAPSAHDRRKRLFLQNDPVHTTNLMVFMKEHLALMQNNVGGIDRFREVCLRNVDDALVDQMNTMFL